MPRSGVKSGRATAAHSHARTADASRVVCALGHNEGARSRIHARTKDKHEYTHLASSLNARVFARVRPHAHNLTSVAQTWMKLASIPAHRHVSTFDDFKTLPTLTQMGLLTTCRLNDAMAMVNLCVRMGGIVL